MKLLYQDAGVIREGKFVPLKTALLNPEAINFSEVKHLGQLAGDIPIDTAGFKMLAYMEALDERVETLNGIVRASIDKSSVSVSEKEIPEAAAAFFEWFGGKPLPETPEGLREEIWRFVQTKYGGEIDANLPEPEDAIRSLALSDKARAEIYGDLESVLSQVDPDLLAVAEGHLREQGALVVCDDLSHILPTIGKDIGGYDPARRLVLFRKDGIDPYVVTEELTHAADHAVGLAKGREFYSQGKSWSAATEAWLQSAREQEILSVTTEASQKMPMEHYAAKGNETVRKELLADVGVAHFMEVDSVIEKMSQQEARQKADGIIATPVSQRCSGVSGVQA